jgi:hypothetical protein
LTRIASKQGRRGRRHSESTVEGMRAELLHAAMRRETVTYGELMRSFGLSRGRALTSAISAVDYREYVLGAPGLAAIIVRKDTGYPGGGYFCDDTLPPKLRRPRSRASDPRLSPSEKNHVSRKQREIWAYYSRKGLSGHS